MPSEPSVLNLEALDVDGVVPEEGFLGRPDIAGMMADPIDWNGGMIVKRCCIL